MKYITLDVTNKDIYSEYGSEGYEQALFVQYGEGYSPESRRLLSYNKKTKVGVLHLDFYVNEDSPLVELISNNTGGIDSLVSTSESNFYPLALPEGSPLPTHLIEDYQNVAEGYIKVYLSPDEGLTIGLTKEAVGKRYVFDLVGYFK